MDLVDGFGHIILDGKQGRLTDFGKTPGRNLDAVPRYGGPGYESNGCIYGPVGRQLIGKPPRSALTPGKERAVAFLGRQEKKEIGHALSFPFPP